MCTLGLWSLFRVIGSLKYLKLFQYTLIASINFTCAYLKKLIYFNTVSGTTCGSLYILWYRNVFFLYIWMMLLIFTCKRTTHMHSRWANKYVKDTYLSNVIYKINSFCMIKEKVLASFWYDIFVRVIGVELKRLGYCLFL